KKKIKLPKNISNKAKFTSSLFIKSENSVDDNTFTFLNVPKQYDSKVNWLDETMPKLWRYNLHYFDYLLEVNRSPSSKVNLIDSWIEHNPIGTGDGWEPYTASLRIVNWIKYFSSLDNKEIKGSWLDSLALQAAWLEKNIEYHILANHYLKNAKALVFSGVYFEGVDASRWLHKGLAIIKEEAAEQLLPDGGHYERSPMYHCIVTEDYLDFFNILSANNSANQELIALIKAKIVKALAFLNNVTLPDGDISLFNDAAFAIAPQPEQLYAYAQRLFGYSFERQFPKSAVIESCPDTGYYVIKNDKDMMIIDCGDVGPDYQPGHAHCDTLSYELALNGQRIIVDSGVHDYENSELRRYVRGTRAHNTVMIDNEEQSEVWGVFRVARRAKPVYANINKVSEHSVRFSGAHDGYKRLQGEPMHERFIHYCNGNLWEVTDVIKGSGFHLCESFIHIHPDFSARLDDDSICLLDNTNSVIAIITINSADQVSIEKGWYCPEFGKKFENDVVVLQTKGNLPVTLAYTIHKQ
ncbi:Heparinase II/III-like, partial [hydrothermal vent metagenome]